MRMNLVLASPMWNPHSHSELLALICSWWRMVLYELPAIRTCRTHSLWEPQSVGQDQTSAEGDNRQLSASTKHISSYGSCRKTLKLMRKFSTWCKKPQDNTTGQDAEGRGQDMQVQLKMQKHVIRCGSEIKSGRLGILLDQIKIALHLRALKTQQQQQKQQTKC